MARTKYLVFKFAVCCKDLKTVLHLALDASGSDMAFITSCGALSALKNVLVGLEKKNCASVVVFFDDVSVKNVLVTQISSDYDLTYNLGCVFLSKSILPLIWG